MFTQLLVSAALAQGALCSNPDRDAALRAHMDNVKGCVLTWADRFSSGSDTADVVADGAIGSCAAQFGDLREASLACDGLRFAEGLDKELRKRFREMAIAQVASRRAR